MSAEVRQAVIMVGGKGTRLRPLTENKPKPILSVLDKPCLMYLIESMVSAGIEEVILACGYKSELLTEAIGDGSDLGIEISYSYEDTLLGTGGAIKNVADRLDETFVAANGDVFADISVKEEIETHFVSGATVTVALTEIENPCEFGIVRMEKDGRISEFKEKPKPEEVFSNLINAGVYVVQKEILGRIDTVPYDFSKDLLPMIVKEGVKVQGYRLKGLWRDVGRPSDLLKANQDVAKHIDTEFKNAERTEITGPFYLGGSSVITDSVSESSIVLKDCRVSSSRLKNSLVMQKSIIDSSVVSDSIIGEGCTVESGSEIRNSVLGDGTVVKSGSVIVDNGVKR
ncbi:MAG: sugar phosphate nucleotidyltransferase [Candidatus Methanomethylophilaceae archaeon]|jgi:mannose-1-phosphate guanylyltransferase